MTEPKDKLRTQALDLLRFPLAIVVLSVHVFSTQGLSFSGEVVNFNDYPVFIEFNNAIDAFLRSQSVPIYYFISGYVFFIGLQTWNNDKFKNKLKNRVKSLLIPYIIWNSIFILQLIFTIYSPFGKYLAQESTFNPTFENFLSCFWMYDGNLAGVSETMYEANKLLPINVPLWFIRDLMIMVLCSPILYQLIKRTKIAVVAVLGCLWGLHQIDISLPFYFPYAAAFFFSWGAYMTIKRKDMIAEFGKYAKISLVLYIALGLLYITAVHIYPDALKVIKGLNIIIGLVFAYNLAVYLIKKGICKSNKLLSASSFFIYITHALVCGKVLKMLFIAIKPENDFTIISVFLFAIILTTLLLLGTFKLMQKFTPRLLSIVAGRK